MGRRVRGGLRRSWRGRWRRHRRRRGVLGDGFAGGGPATGGMGAGGGSTPRTGGGGGGDPQVTACNDGIDNDGDGLTDWQHDLGCWGPDDMTEAARPRAEENGYTTFDIPTDSVVVYVAADGDDSADGTRPERAVRTLTRAAALVRPGEHDFVLLRRGDRWRDPQWPRRWYSGRDAAHPLVVSTYGASTVRPRIEVLRPFVNHDGRVRNFTVMAGLHIVNARADPSDPAFDGTGMPVFRYTGGGEGHLIEDCHIEYGEITVNQCCGRPRYRDIEVRRSVVEKSYYAGTCDPNDKDGDGTNKPSGMYTAAVDNLLIEGNVFDHNGWNEDVPSACATIYNHNLYLSGNDITIRGNVLARASSIHAKIRADAPGTVNRLTVENNVFVEGEIGISAGGNTVQSYRFRDGVVRNNVFTHIGRSNPTDRNVAWGIDIRDHDRLLLADNLFLNQVDPGGEGTHALRLMSGTNRDLMIENNLFYRIRHQALRAQSTGGHRQVTVRENHFVDVGQGACLVSHSGSFAHYTYASNRYSSQAAAGQWFCVNGGRQGLTSWASASGEGGAVVDGGGGFPDPARTIETYATSLGLAGNLPSYLVEARKLSRFNFREAYLAPAVADYLRAGFGR
ncbi:MAG: right-handed parallel beta-helix repeat-containing protein [Myxococcota bacterium]